MLNRIPQSPTDEELIEVLSAISIVSLRLAKNLRAATRQEPDECPCQHPMHTCPYLRERRAPHETVRG